jgi:hypothetical protein
MISTFKFFDPLKDRLQYWSYSGSAQNILWRARALVRGRSSDEISAILCDADAILDCYFDNERDEAIRLIEQEGRHDLIEYDEDGRFNAFRPEAFDHYDIRDKDTISDLDALDDALEQFFDPSTVDVENIREFEYFGCLALSLFEDLVRRRDFKYNLETHEYEKKPSGEVSSQDRLRIAEILLEALDCVSRGETKKVRSDVTERYEKKIEEIKEKQGEVEKLRIEEIKGSIKTEMSAAEAVRRKEEAAARNDVRHHKNRSVKAKVIQWYAAEYRDFPSAAQAAKAFCQRLSDEDNEREQRTVETWLRAFAKEKGIRLTP